MAEQVNDLERERQRLVEEIRRQTEISGQTEVDPRTKATVTSGDAITAQKRLEKLNDDYRQLLIAMKPAASTINSEIKQLEDGRFVRISPEGVATLVEGIPPSAKPQTLDQQTIIINGKAYDIDPSNPNGDFRVRAGATTEDDQKKARDRAVRERNEALNGHYATDSELLDFTTKLQQSGIDKTAAAEVQRVSEANQRRLDAEESRKAALQPGTIAQQGATLQNTNATTGQIGANTGQINQNIEFAAQDQPGKLAQQGATLEGTRANTAGTEATAANQRQATTIAGAPQVQAPQAGMSQWSRDPITGKVTQGDINPEWQAKTQADVAARVGQIQMLANAKKAEVMGKVGENYSADQAYAEFNSWYDQNVGPHVGALQAAQQAAQLEQAKAQQAMRVSAMTTAQASGQQGLNAFQQLREAHPVSDRTQDVMTQIRSGKSPKDIDMNGAFTWQGPNPIDLAQQQTQSALKYIDPQSAQANGLPPPNFSGIDIESMLGRQQYMPGRGAQPAPPQAPPPAAPPGGGFDWQALMGRQAADVVLQRQQAGMGQQPPFKTGWPGSDPRLSGIYDPSQYIPGG